MALVFCVWVGKRRGCVAYVAFCRIVTNVPAVVSVYDIVVLFVRALVEGLVQYQSEVYGYLSVGLQHVLKGLLWAGMGCFDPFVS